MLQETELIVLNAVRYSDTAAIVHTYSRAFGPLHLKVSRTSARKAAGTRAFFTPFSLLSVVLDYRPKREVQIPSESRLLYCPACIATDPVANAVTLFLTELLFKLLRNEEPEERLFGLIKEEIALMDRLTSAEMANYHLVFLLKLLPAIGVMPVIDDYRPGWVLNLDEGGFMPPFGPAQNEDRAPSETLIRLLRADDPYLCPLNQNSRQALLRLLLRYLSRHYPSLDNLRSPAVLSELFG